MRLLRQTELAWEEGNVNGVRRAWTQRGEGGLYAFVTQMPANVTIAPHSHTVDETIVILDGSLQIEGDGHSLSAGDVLSVPANSVYGFTSGPAGLKFFNVRAADGSLNWSTPGRARDKEEG